MMNVKNKLMIGIFLGFIVGLGIGLVDFTEAGYRFHSDDPYDYFVIDHHLPQNIINYLMNKEGIVNISIEPHPIETFIYFDREVISKRTAENYIKPYTYQHDHMELFSEDLLGLDRPIACGRDRVTNDLYAVYIDDGVITREVVSNCND